MRFMLHSPSEPDPREHAIVVLEVCNGHLAEAREICLTNMMANRASGLAYWQAVLAELTPLGEA